MATDRGTKQRRIPTADPAPGRRSVPASAGGLLIGSVATVVGVVALAVGSLDPLNSSGLDLHFRHLSKVEADPRIVLIDINDHALETVGEWPWPRRRYAQLVGILNELEAKAIVLDLALSDPSPPRTEHAGLGKHYDIDTELAPTGDPTEDPTIYDDDELRDAMAAAGNVYLAMYSRLSPPDVDPSTALETSLKLIRQDPEIGFSEFSNSLTTSLPAVDRVFELRSFYDQARIVVELQQEFGLDAPALVRRLGTHGHIDGKTVEKHLARAKQTVARQTAAKFLADHPKAKWSELFRHALPDTSYDVWTPDRNDLLDAFRYQHSHRALLAVSPPTSGALTGRAQHAYDLTLPVDKFAETAKGIGFVTFERKKSGGVIRDVPLVVQTDGALLFQLGLLAALDELRIDRSGIEFHDHHLVLGSGSETRRIPLADDGSSLLNWHVPQRIDRWQDSFTHIPITRVLEIALNREAVAENERRLGLAMGALVKFRHSETQATYTDYVRLVNEHRALKRQLDHPADPQVRQAAEEGVQSTRAAIAEIESDAVLWLRRVHELWKTTDPVNETERAERAQIFSLYDKFGEQQLAAQVNALNANLATRTENLLEELKPQLEGKMCFVGYTASGVADLVTSPIYTSMPGVMAHANVANMVLQDRSARRATAFVNGLIMLVFGLIITGVASARGPVLSLLGLWVLGLLLAAISGYAFWSSSYYIASPSAIIQVCVSWACVTAYRQFTEERSRRQFQRALAQYTSPAVAARIADRASARDLAPGPATVTCFFSDLKSFTELSERLGAERTRLILNPYLRSMSAVLVQHRGLVNKFMGDGIFAFFNAPIWPCSNHGEQACACALASLTALSELNREVDARGDGEALVMRIGLATGEAFVGDYGSDTKLDYTCIGDTVNLASRLERACKVLGTSILVADATRQQAGTRFAFRPLGRLTLPGKRIAVDAHELVGLADTVETSTTEYATQFERMTHDYQACEWDTCLEQLERCRIMRGEDPALDLYREAVKHHRNNPPPQDWDGTVTLLGR